MTTNPPPPFDADAARRLSSLTDFEQSHLWCNCEDFDPPERCGSCQAWDRIKADIRAAVAEVERLRKGRDSETKRAKDWMNKALSYRCQKCTHEKGPIRLPEGHERLGKLIYVCPCECHRDMSAEVDRLRERVKELEQAGERVAGDDTASLNAGLSLPNLQVTRDLRDSRDMT
jgi:hypothetical protein